MASELVCIPVNMCISGCKFLKWKHVTDFVGNYRLYLLTNYIILNLTILPGMHDEAVCTVYHVYTLWIDFDGHQVQNMI